MLLTKLYVLPPHPSAHDVRIHLPLEGEGLIEQTVKHAFPSEGKVSNAEHLTDEVFCVAMQLGALCGAKPWRRAAAALP